MTQQETDAVIGRLVREEKEQRAKKHTLECAFQQTTSELVDLVQKLKKSPQDIDTISFDKEALEIRLAEYREVLTALAELDQQQRKLGLRPEPQVIT